MHLNLIVDLPQVLQASILCDWLEEIDGSVCRLDSAYCNKKLRSDFVQTLSTTYIFKAITTNETDVIEWIFARKLRVKDIILVTDTLEDQEFIEALLNQVGAEATSITFEHSEEFGDPNDPTPFRIPFYVWPAILQSFPKLQRLNCENGVVDPGLAEVIKQSNQLQTINFKGARDLTTDIMRACCASLSLETLILIKTRHISVSPGLVFFPHDSIMHVVETRLANALPDFVLTAEDPPMHNLKTLLVAGSSFSAVTLASLLKHAPNLTELSVNLKGEVDIPFVAAHSSKLTKCTLHDAPVVDADTATVLCKGCPSLQQLTLLRPSTYFTAPMTMACTEEALIVLATQCVSLQRLVVISSTLERKVVDYSTSNTTNNTSSTKTNTKASTDTSTDLAASQLVDLQIGFVSVATLRIICASCPHLHALHLHYQQQVIAEETLSLLQTTSVHTLVLEQMQLEDDLLLQIKNIQQLYIHACRGFFTAPGLANMALLNPNLTTFSLTYAPTYINHRVIYEVLDVCPKIKYFEFAMPDTHRQDTTAHYALRDIVRHTYPNLTKLKLSV